MKIIYINCSRIPTERAHGLQIMKMCEAFAGTCDVELWVPRRLNTIKEDPFEYYGIKRNFAIKKIPCIDFIAINRAPVGFWLTELTFLLFVIFYRAGARADIIYTRDKFVAFVLSIFKSNIYLEEHTVPARIFFNRIKKLKGLILITNGLKKVFQEHGVSVDKILLVPDGVDVEEFAIQKSKAECRSKLNLPHDKKIVLYTGHLYPWKGVDTLCEAVKYLPGNVLIYIVGGTEHDIKINKLQLKTHNLQHVAHRPHKEIPYWLKAADVLVLPNSEKYDISKYWTSPLKLFEYMVSGRPIVASDLPSIREILNETNSVLVESDNPEKLALGIKIVLEDFAFSEGISTKAAFGKIFPKFFEVINLPV